MLLRRSVLGERPGEHELGLKHGVDVFDHSVQRRGQISMDRVLDPALNVGDDAPGVFLVPSPVQRFSGDAELDDEIVAEMARSRRAFPARGELMPPRLHS
jgi:hypothetical protein